MTFGIPGLRWGYAYLVTYPGVSLLALAASADSFVVTDHRRVLVLVLLATVWVLDLGMTALSAVLLWRTLVAPRSPNRPDGPPAT